MSCGAFSFLTCFFLPRGSCYQLERHLANVPTLLLGDAVSGRRYGVMADAGNGSDEDASADLPVPSPPMLAVRRCAQAVPIILAEDLRAALSFFPQEVRARRPRTEHPPRPAKRARRRRPRGADGASRSGAASAADVTGGAAGTGDARRPRQRRRRGARDAGAGDADPDAPVERIDPMGAGDDDVGGGLELSEPEPDVVDNRPEVLALIDIIASRITQALGLALSAEPEPIGSHGTLFRVACVADGAAVVLSEGERGYAVWCARVRGDVLFLCSCGGRGGAESVEMRTSVGLSSTCCHARALQASVVTLSAAAGVATANAFLHRFPKLDNGAGASVTEYTAHFATKTERKRGVFAVQSGGAWAVVVIRHRMGKSCSKKRQQMRAACTQLSCAKDHWWCRHAAAVTEWCTELRATTAAANEMGGNFTDPFRDVHLPEAPAGHSPAPAVPPEAVVDAAFSDEARWRSSRNFLPCSGEVSDCLLWDQLAAAGRETDEPTVFPSVLCEAVCFKCGDNYNGLGVKHSGGVLHTLRGRVAVTVRRWTCGCGEPVPYDGASESLFASTSKTIFTRTFMDVMSQMVFTGHSTLSSAASVLCFLLEVTKSLSGASSALARQTVISAVHRYARTLIVPASLFRCAKCKVDGDRPYWAVIADGEVLSILRSQSQPLFRVMKDVRVIAIDTSFASVLPLAWLRAAVRKSLPSERLEAVRLSKTEFSSLRDLASFVADTPAPHGAGVVISNPMTLQWAASLLFFSYFSLGLTDQAPPPAADSEEAYGDDGDDGDTDAEPPGGTRDTIGGRAVNVDAAQAAFAAPIAGGIPAAAAGAAVNGADASPGNAFHVAVPMAEAVGTGLPAIEMRERWRTVRRFLSTFLGQPVLGAFAGLDRQRIRALAVKMIRAQQVEEWRHFAVAVESVGIVWPFLRLVGMGVDTDPLMTRAIAELMLYTCDVDDIWESEWRRRAPPASIDFEREWRDTSTTKLTAHAAAQPGPPSASRRLGCSSHSLVRADAQAEEVRSSQVWPDLDPVRPYITDGKADAVNAARAAKVGADRETLRAMAAKELGEDDCRHKWLTSETFMPGIENFLCPCGVLIGFDFLDKAEAPSHVLASLVQRFPLLPKVVYFDTACQLARNAARRVPWLVNQSGLACSLDRPHNLKHQHKCSRIFDADAYPARSVRHSTACAESRHSINKAYKTHLAHLRQDHFIIRMRLLAATINLRVKMRRELGKETNHRRMCTFFHSYVQDYCDRPCCTCAAGMRQQAAAAAADSGDDAGDNGGDGQGGGGEEQNGLAAAAEATPLHPVHAIVANALPTVVLEAVKAASQEAGLAAGHAAGHVFGRAAGLAAVQAAFHLSKEAGDTDAGVVAGQAAAQAAGQCAAFFPVQATVQAAVQQAVLVGAAEMGQASALAAVEAVCADLGDAAGLAAARAVDAAAGRLAPAADTDASAAAHVAVTEDGAAGEDGVGGMEQHQDQRLVDAANRSVGQRTDGQGAGGRGVGQDPDASQCGLVDANANQLDVEGLVSGQAAVRAALLDALQGLGVVAARDDPVIAEEVPKQDNGGARDAVAVPANMVGHASSESDGAMYSGGEVSADEEEL